MLKYRRAIMWLALVLIIVLTALSVYGAFLGADRAQAFFNSLPLAVYWFTLAGLLIAGLVIFRRLLQIPSLLLMHLGSILVLAGGMWGSQAGQAIQKQLFGTDRIPKGRMAIREGTEDNRVWIADGNDVRELPFSVRLNDFRIEYYRVGTLVISSGGRTWRLRAEPGARISLGPNLGRITVRNTFENFKLRTEEGRHVPYDAPGGSNPAVQILIERPDGTTTEGYVFEHFSPIFPTAIDFNVHYQRAISDYISELEIVEDGKVVAAKDIEVNHPLHYGGYHFYQSSYGKDQGGEYTVLMVVSDSGLNAIYGGYVMLIAGNVWHFWGRRTLTSIRNRRRAGSAAPSADPHDGYIAPQASAETGERHE